jgi:predicted DNA-binding transcriptional regulator AlpA
MQPTKNQRIATFPELCAYTKLSSSFWRKYTLYNTDLSHFKIGRRVLFDLDAVDRWLEARRRNSTSDKGGLK